VWIFLRNCATWHCRISSPFCRIFTNSIYNISSTSSSTACPVIVSSPVPITPSMELHLSLSLCCLIPLHPTGLYESIWYNFVREKHRFVNVTLSWEQPAKPGLSVLNWNTKTHVFEYRFLQLSIYLLFCNLSFFANTNHFLPVCFFSDLYYIVLEEMKIKYL
jgi:hypothetical protein